MDLFKAFDAVSYIVLLHMLHHYGIRGPAYALIEYYLNSRSQFVAFYNIFSFTNSINIGVPQGLIFGPLTFPNIYKRLTIHLEEHTPSICS